MTRRALSPMSRAAVHGARMTIETHERAAMPLRLPAEIDKALTDYARHHRIGKDTAIAELLRGALGIDR